MIAGEGKLIKEIRGSVLTEEDLNFWWAARAVLRKMAGPMEEF